MIKSNQDLNYFVNLCGFQQAFCTFEITAAKAVFDFMIVHQLSPLALLDPDTLKGLCPSQQALSHCRHPQTLSTQFSAAQLRCVAIKWLSSYRGSSLRSCQILSHILWNPTVHYRTHNSHSWARSTHSAPHHAVSYTYIVMSPYLHAGPSSDLFPGGFLTKILCSFLFSSSYRSPPSTLPVLQGPLCMDHNRVWVFWHKTEVFLEES